MKPIPVFGLFADAFRTLRSAPWILAIPFVFFIMLGLLGQTRSASLMTSLASYGGPLPLQLVFLLVTVFVAYAVLTLLMEALTLRACATAVDGYPFHAGRDLLFGLGVYLRLTGLGIVVLLAFMLVSSLLLGIAGAAGGGVALAGVLLFVVAVILAVLFGVPTVNLLQSMLITGDARGVWHNLRAAYNLARPALGRIWLVLLMLTLFNLGVFLLMVVIEMLINPGLVPLLLPGSAAPVGSGGSPWQVGLSVLLGSTSSAFLLTFGGLIILHLYRQLRARSLP